MEEPANDTCARGEIARFPVKGAGNSLKRSPPGHRPGQGQLIGVFEVPSNGQAVGRPCDRDTYWRKGPLQINRSRLSLYIRVGGDDHLGDALRADPLQQLGNVNLLRS